MEEAEPAPIVYRALEIDDPWEHVLMAGQHVLAAVGDRPAANPVAALEEAVTRGVDRREDRRNDVRQNDATDVKVRLDEPLKPIIVAPDASLIPAWRTIDDRRKQHMKPNRFDGTGSFESFLKQFEVCARHNGWTETEKIDFLQNSLDKSAVQLLWDFGSTVDVTYYDLVARLRQRYGLEAQTETFRVQLRYRRQREKESLADLLHDIRRLVALAYPAPGNETTETIACDAFLEAMHDKELSLKVREKEGKTLNEVFRTAVRMEAYKLAFNENSFSQERQRPAQRQVRSAKEDEGSAALIERMESFMTEQRQIQSEWMRDMESRLLTPQLPSKVRFGEVSPASATQPPPTTTPWSPGHVVAQTPGGRAGTSHQGKPPVRCFNCNKLGHLKRDCRSAPVSRSDRVNFNNPGFAKRPPGGRSLYAKCTIDGKRCMCLIDTGSQSNLIPARLAEGCKLSPTSKELTAANGTTILVKGEVTLSVKFSGQCRRAASFVVCEQIIEPMLGLDFLIDNGCELSLSQGRMVMGRATIPLIKRDGTHWCRRVDTCGEITIPPRTQMDVPSRVVRGAKEIRGTSEWMLEHQEIQPGVHLARSLVDGNAEKVMVRVVNVSNETVVLYENDHLGELCPVTVTDRSGPPKTTASAPTGKDLLAQMDCEAPDEVRDQLEDLLQEYNDVFSSRDDDLGYCTVTRHRIDTGNARPVRQPLRAHPRAHRETIDAHVESMLKNDLIEAAQSEWASNVVLARKKDGSMRFCLDYRGLNNVTRGDAYPLPRITDSLDALSGATWFSTLDLRSGYHQIGMHPEDADKTAFVTRRGAFRWRRMPMGLSGATATFQRTMDLILSGLNFVICLVYLDDVIVFSTTPQQHLDRLREVFNRLRGANLKLKVQKCRLMKKRVEFLGHIVSPEGVSADPEKIQKIVDWTPPRCLKELRAFLGLCSYYRRFVHGFAQLAAPLNELTKKNCEYEWNRERQEAFDELKKRLTSSPVLGLPTDEGEYVLDTDASDASIGAVLSQRQAGTEKVLAYGSRRLSAAERNYCVTRRELLAVVYFMKYYKTYLLGKPFVLRTDHAALQWLQRTPDPIGQQARWQEKLSEFDFKIVHRPGKSHGNADGLSRRPEPDAIPLLVAAVRNGRPEPGTDVCPVPADSSMQTEQEGDALLSVVRDRISSGWPELEEILEEDEASKTLWHQRHQLKLLDGVLYRERNDGTRQLVVPKKLRYDFTRLAHSGMTGGHLGVRRTRLQVRRRAYWPGWSKDVDLFCKSCEECCRYRQGRPPRQGKLRPLRCGAPWEILAVDVTGPHPTSSKGHVYILTLMDYFTKFVEAIPMRNQEAPTIARIIVERICAVYGTPLRILTDRGPAFESVLFREMCRLLGVEKVRTTSYEPRTNGMIERFHRTMNSMIGKMVNENHRNWHEILPFVAAAYRASVHECTGFSPNFLVFGRENKMPLDLVYGSPPEQDPVETVEYVRTMREMLEDAYALVRRNLGVAAERRKRRYDIGVRTKEFKVGDEVWVFVPRKRRGKYPKWERFYQGPYVVLEKTGPLNYRVQKRPSGKVFVTHADKLIPVRRSREGPEDEPLRDADECQREEEGSTNSLGNEGKGQLASYDKGKNLSSPRDLRPRQSIRRPARFAD